MEELEQFRFANLTIDNVEKINDLSIEQLEHLKTEKGVLIIENRATKQRGSSSFANLLVLHSLNALKKYKVVGFKHPKVTVQLPKARYQKFEEKVQEPEIVIEVVKPEIPLFNQTPVDGKIDFPEAKKTRTRKPKTT